MGAHIRTGGSGAGHGWLEELRAGVDIPVDAGLLPDARSMPALALRLIDEGRACSAGEISINYLRNRVAEKARS